MSLFNVVRVIFFSDDERLKKISLLKAALPVDEAFHCAKDAILEQLTEYLHVSKDATLLSTEYGYDLVSGPIRLVTVYLVECPGTPANLDAHFID